MRAWPRGHVSGATFDFTGRPRDRANRRRESGRTCLKVPRGHGPLQQQLELTRLGLAALRVRAGDRSVGERVPVRSRCESSTAPEANGGSESESKRRSSRFHLNLSPERNNARRKLHGCPRGRPSRCASHRRRSSTGPTLPTGRLGDACARGSSATLGPRRREPRPQMSSRFSVSWSRAFPLRPGSTPAKTRGLAATSGAGAYGAYCPAPSTPSSRALPQFGFPGGSTHMCSGCTSVQEFQLLIFCPKMQ